MHFLPNQHKSTTFAKQSNSNNHVKTNKEMKNKLTYPLICCIAMMMVACSGSSNGKPKQWSYPCERSQDYLFGL